MNNLTVDEGLVIKLTADQLSQSPLKNSARGFTILTMPAAFRRTVDKPLDILAGDDSRGMKIFWDRIFNRNRNDLVYYAVDVRTRKYEFTLQPASAGRRYTTSARFRMQYEVHDPSKVALDKEDALRGVVDAVEKYIASIIADQTRINMWLLSSMDMILSNKLAELVTLYDEWGIVIKDLTLLEWALPDSYTSDYESHLKRVQEDKERQEEIARRRESQDRERKKREDETKHTIEMQRIEDDTAKQLHELERLKLDWQRKDDFEREQIEAQYKLQMEEVQANLVELQKRNSTRQSRLQAALAKDTAWLEDRQDELRTQDLLAANTRRDDVESAELERRRRHALDEEYHISDVEIIRIERISKKLELMGITETNFPSIRPMLMANPDKTYEIFNILFTQGLEQSKYLLDKFISTNETLILQGDKDTGDYNDLLKNLLLHNVTPQTAGLLGGVNPATETPKLTDQTPIQHDTADNSDYDSNDIFQRDNYTIVEKIEQEDHQFTPKVINTNYVQFTAFHPKEIVAERWYTLLVYTHLDTVIDQVQIDSLKFSEEMARNPRKVVSRQKVRIARGTELRIIPVCKELKFKPAWSDIKWDEDFERTTFRFTTSDNKIDQAVSGEILICLGPIEIAKINFSVYVIPDSPMSDDIDEEIEISLDNPLARAKLNRSTANIYNKIFISYSRVDTELANAYRLAQLAVGNDVFMDTESIRAGEDWQEALARAIDNADIFQLFWSSSSALSPNVKDEWDYALKHKCPEDKCRGFIRPAYWEKPMPNPPTELGHLNFRYVSFGGKDK